MPNSTINDLDDRRNSLPEKDQWKETNSIWQYIEIFGIRVDQVIDGTASKRFIIISGPPEIGKTTIGYKKLGAFSKRLYQGWEATDPDQRPEYLSAPSSWGEPQFKDPFIILSGKITPRRLYMALYDYQYHLCIIILDDIEWNPGLMSIVHQATTNPHHIVAWDTSQALIGIDAYGNMFEYDKRFSFKGSLIIINNEKKDSPEMLKKYTPQLRSRAWEIPVPWNHDHLVEYVDKLGFQDGGMYDYIIRPKARGGLAMKMTPEQALPILVDVRNYLYAHLNVAKRIGFRMLEDLVFDRITGEADWKRRAYLTITK